ncbi:hypothetical protein [Streptomyces marispadix]|uniref:Secreted protein n=1 Tax=Streptomyces marispadix TaxID=2922868 RepID=A0ABS9SYS2_9ACTN|nr:hypothetical protein [Streptomyces marispadix]MCH6161418.1 hypothetical protein [Streptomyces marispadix]
MAAVVGLIGALGGAITGGYAAIRGAREAADRSARAALEQAAQQASDQHEHWLRQERRSAYAELLQDAEDFLMKLADLVSCVENQAEDGVRVLEALEGVMTAQIQVIRRMGPVMTIAGRDVATHLRHFVSESRSTSAQLMGLRPPDLPVDLVRSRYNTMTEHFGHLVLSVAREVQAGPTSSSVTTRSA